MRYAGWFVLLYVVLFWRLGQPTFWDPDEAHYAETTRELLRSGEWTTPYYNEEPFFDKPILFHLFQAVPMAIFGPSELAARLVPALAALALIATTAWIGASLASTDVALVAALLLAVSPGVFALARYAILDTLFAAFLFSGASLVTVAALRDRAGLQWGGYVLIAMAVLTKGPVAIILCGLAFLLSIALSPDARRRLPTLHWLIGLLLVIAIAAPWYLYMWYRFGSGFIEGHLLRENVRLFARSMYRGQPNWWFYFQILAAGLLPWTALLVGRLWDDVHRAVKRQPPDAFEMILWAWTIAVVGFFAFSKFRLDHYIFPAAPSLCLLTARAWADLRARPGDPLNSGARIGLHLVGPLLVAIGTGAGYFLMARLELPRWAVIVPAIITVGGATVAARINIWGQGPPRVPRIVLGVMTITYAGIILFVLPELERRKVVPELARWVLAHAGPTDRVATFRLNRWNTAFRFYVDRHTTLLESQGEALEFFERPDPFYCAMLEPAYQEFVARGVPLQVVQRREGMWMTSGRVLWRRRIPPAQFLIVTGASWSPEDAR